MQLHQQKGMISLSPPTICNSANSVAWNVSLIDSQTSFVEFDESKDTSDFDTVKDNQTKRRFKGKSTGGGFKKAEGES
ncbi:hypothetical protein P676_1632 [Acinetobacter baumannii UH7607]|nr:hypothetical protein P676_1632 [Acinetobacter baumannii UH7607]